jgi:NADPH:quinone reductase-like Zn-dependent oxidoreductase
MKDKRALWKVVGTLTGILSGMATRTVLKAVWKRVKGGDPPTNPAAPGTSWKEALVWAASSGVAMAVTRLVAQRGAAEAWKKELGSYPPGLETVSP